MQEISTQVPAYIFAAVNLLLLAYFNRFHALSTRIRDLAAKDRMKQVMILRKRLQYARNMILYGIASIFTGMIDILVIAGGYQKYGWIIFVIAILFVCISLLYAVKEIWEGTAALDEELTSHDCNTYNSDV
jgi:hypothetical protein